MAGEHPSVMVKRICEAENIPASAFSRTRFPNRAWLASFLAGFDDLSAPNIKYASRLAKLLGVTPDLVRQWQEDYRPGSTARPKPRPIDDEKHRADRERYRQRQAERKKWNPESDTPITDWAKQC